MEFDPNLRTQSSAIGNWWMSRSTSSGYGQRFVDSTDYEYGTSTPYYQTGEQRRGGLIGMWKKIMKMRSKKKIFKSNNIAVSSSPGSRASSYDPCAYMQNFDRGSARMEPENLSRSFSVQFANPSAYFRG